MSSRLSRDWQVVELGQLAVDGPTNGYSPPSAPEAGGTRSLKLSATTQGRLVLNKDTVKHLHESIAKDSWAWLEPGDLLVQRANTADLVGTAAIFDGPPHSYVYPDLMMRLRFADEATTKWVWRYINAPAGRRYIGAMAAGAAGSMPKISGAKLKAMPIPLPPLPERRRIADILDKADAIRLRRKEAIALVQELLRSAFLEMFGDPVTNPKGWEVKELGELVDIRGGGTPSRARDEFFDGCIPWVTAKDFRADHIFDSKEHVSDEAVGASATQVVPVGTVLVVVKSKVLMHRLPVAIAQVPLCFNQDVKGLVANEPNDSAYIAAHLRLGQQQLLRLARGVNTEGLTIVHLRSLPVMRPPSRLIKAFAAIDLRTRGTLERVEGALGDAERLFNSLVAKAFSGRLRGAAGTC